LVERRRHTRVLQHALERVTRELDSARKTQRSLLPETNPVIAGFDIAGWSKAASATGGDFYDYISLPGGHLGLVLADVMGHGLASSLLACECRALVRALASMSASVETIITRSNEILHTDLKAERFVTMFIGDLDPSTSALRYVSAGQGPPLHWRDRDAACRLLDVTTPPLGLFPTIDGPPERLLIMEPGDVFVLATDGFNEWSNPRNEQFGISRLSHLIQQTRHKPAAEIINSLLEAVMTFANGTRQEDDLTAIVVKRL
jgi:serine phosphatase RsbU (regulator of sigma subunit)